MRTVRIAALALALVAGGLGCKGNGGGEGGGGDTEPITAGGNGPSEPVTAAADWRAPDCGGDGDLDRSAPYGDGSLRLCVREGEVRFWALDAAGRPDSGFAKGSAEVRFIPAGGSEQMVSGIILKGTPGEGYATRMLGHGGAGVTEAVVTVDGTEVRF